MSHLADFAMFNKVTRYDTNYNYNPVISVQET